MKVSIKILRSTLLNPPQEKGLAGGRWKAWRERLIGLTVVLIFCLSSTYAQVNISGTVKDAQGEALPGVSVRVKGTPTGASTDADGRYSIAVPGSESVLVFSFIGFTNVETKVGSRTVVNVTMEISTESLEEVVVVGYGTMRKSDVTSSISSISAKDIKDLPQAGVDQMLQGKVSGVTVTNNGGQPGGGVSVKVRGNTSINSNEPLYVVDGVIQEARNSSISYDQLGGVGGQTSQSAIAGLNPNDIENVEILKDASAQAIYGSRAANGVVIITTKRGKAGQSKVSYDAYYGLSTIPKKLDLMDLREFAAFSNSVRQEIAAVENTSMLPIPEFQKPEILGKGTDWQDAIFRTAGMQNHQLSFSGGSEKTNYYLSLNYFDQEGVVIGSNYDRYSTRFNIDNHVKDWLKVGLSSSFSRNNQRVALTNGTEGTVQLAVYNSPAAPVTTLNGEYATTVSVGGYNFGNALNPVARAELRKVTKLQNQLTGNLYGEIVFNKNFKLRNELNVNYSGIENKAFQPNVVLSSGYNLIGPSTLREQRSNSLYYALVNYLNYSQTFNKHSVTSQLGHEAQRTSSNNIVGMRRNLILNFESLAAGEQNGQTLDGSYNDWAMESYFARAGYTYDDRFSLNLSARRDGSSSFGPDNRIGYFTAASAGWTITNEKFAKNWKTVNYLKMRVGAGSVGNQSAGSNNYTTNIRLFASGPFGAGGIPDNVGNTKLGWESVVTYNAGIDAGLLNRRLEVKVDVYDKVTTDMLMRSELPIFTGIGTSWDDIKSPYVNAGNMRNRGIDIGINSYNITKPDFNWTTNIVFSHYKNTLRRLNNDQAALMRYTEYGNAVTLTRTVIGGPLGRFYGFVTDGLFGSVAEIQNSADQGLAIGPKGTWLGDVKFKDLNNDDIIDDKDVTFIGDPNPDFTYGITNSFKYKGFDLGIFLQGSYGGDILNYTRRTTERLFSPYFNQLATVTNRYSADNPDGNMPRFNQWHNSNWRVSDRFIEDGSYMRIQNVTLGYNLPAKFINKVKMTNARIYVTAQNLYTFTNYSGVSPELGAYNSDVLMQNVDNGSYPNPRTFNFGINVTF
ncbi:SusC/RagA family TonB-linked outer membrane protein [Haoranjiania flava]|uniref:TonB-dependent receptor n=1 Tax=Haoranjiania flava TaxID=1856322 RepID=A0AAE3LQT7_9BACT|nr:TonB-dependent receptor [Haoranjiania flava]MCU7694785.1 TonB-dependent receptor [Haoranjiania flava]